MGKGNAMRLREFRIPAFAGGTWSSAVVSVAVACMCVSRASAGMGTVLENDALRIECASAEAGFGIVSVESKLGGGAKFVHCDAMASSNFWALTFSSAAKDGAARKVVIDNHVPAAAKRVEKRGNETRFVWQGIKLPEDSSGSVDVVASVILNPGKGDSEWRISVNNSSRNWALMETMYPRIREVVRPGEADVLMPYENLGARLLKKYNGKSRNRMCQWGEYAYPSYYPPVTAFMKGDSGIYFAAEDPEARIKRMFVWDVDTWFTTPVENAGVGGKAAEGPRYPVVIAAFKGDWWQAAKRYRKWALKQKWAAKGPIVERNDFPKSMLEPSLWLSWYMETPQGMSNWVSRVKRDLPDVKSGLRWYKWHSGGMCLNFPEYFPVKAPVPELSKYFADCGIVTMPYTNGRLWDTKLMSFRYARKDACMRENGDFYPDPYGGDKAYGRHDFAVMCPYAKDWQDTMCEFTDRTVDEAKANAIYYDQIGCAGYRLCFNPDHGHPVGGGSWWADGYRAMLERMHDKYAPQNVALTTEGTAECYMDVCDGQLVVTSATGEDVPFWPAVYSGYAIYFGTRQSSRKPFDPTFALMAREFTWGVVNGWSDDWYPNRWGTEKRTAEATCAFARAREANRDLFVYGTLEDELRPLNPIGKREYEWKGTWSKHAFTGEVAVVTGTWWTDRSGSKVLVAVNTTDEPQTVKFIVPGGKKSTVRNFKPREIVVENFGGGKAQTGKLGPLDLGANKYDYVCFRPKMPWSENRKVRATFPSDRRGDCYNDHCHVINDESRNVFYAIWTQATWEGAPDSHIAFSKSRDGGITWTEPRVIAGSESRNAYAKRALWQQPMLAKSGRIYVLWNQTPSTNVSQVCGEMYGRYSDDAGETWSVPQKVPFSVRMDADPENPATPPLWCNWQRPLRLGEDGRFFVGCSRHGKAPYDRAPCCKVEFWQYNNIDDNPQVKDIAISYFATNRLALSAEGAERKGGFKAAGPAVEEASVVKLPDGRLFALMRSSVGSPVWSQSPDGGRTWTEPDILRDENGRPFLHSRSPCPMYDWKGCEAGSGTYFALVHDTFDFNHPKKSAYQRRGPLYFLAGKFAPNDAQPVRFVKKRMFAERSVGNSFYSSYTVRNGEGVLWFNDRKYYILGRKIGPEWFAD